MAEKDITEKDLRETKTKSFYKIENRVHEQERDVSKYWGKLPRTTLR